MGLSRLGLSRLQTPPPPAPIPSPTPSALPPPSSVRATPRPTLVAVRHLPRRPCPSPEGQPLPPPLILLSPPVPPSLCRPLRRGYHAWHPPAFSLRLLHPDRAVLLPCGHRRRAAHDAQAALPPPRLHHRSHIRLPPRRRRRIPCAVHPSHRTVSAQSSPVLAPARSSSACLHRRLHASACRAGAVLSMPTASAPDLTAAA